MNTTRGPPRPLHIYLTVKIYLIFLGTLYYLILSLKKAEKAGTCRRA
jgi:hypothetical protein